MGVTQKQWKERVDVWKYFVIRHRLSGRYFSAHRRLFVELKRKGVVVPEDPPLRGVSSKYWVIKPGITRMPAFIDPTHAWQIRAWQALRWHSAGVTAHALCVVLGHTTVTPRQMRAWLNRLVLCGVCRKTRVKGLAGSHYQFSIIGTWRNDPEPPHRYVLQKRIEVLS